MQVNLLRSLPKSKRPINARAKAKSHAIINESMKFGEMYFDGPREYGYGGYTYDGRWRSVARDIIKHYNLKPGMRVLDIGCAKGFLVKDLRLECNGLNAFGVDVSKYALQMCEPEVSEYLSLASADDLPFDNNDFDLVIAINSVHNLDEKGVRKALSEIKRVGKNDKSFIVVDAYETPEQKQLFTDWVLTAKSHGYPQYWIDIFNSCDYQGDYDWTILTS